MDKVPGWKDLVVCGRTDSDGVLLGFNHDCGFSDLILVAKNLITDLVILGTIATTFILIYAGIRLLTSGGDTKRYEETKKMLGNVLKGFGIMIVAWVLVYTILNALVGPEYTSLLGK
jgi:hypothetical protein